jgi:hypothetical protein
MVRWAGHVIRVREIRKGHAEFLWGGLLEIFWLKDYRTRWENSIKAYCSAVVHEDSLGACSHFRAVTSVLNLFQSVCWCNDL